MLRELHSFPLQRVKTYMKPYGEVNKGKRV